MHPMPQTKLGSVAWDALQVVAGLAFMQKAASHKDELFVVFAGMPIVRKANEHAAFCQAEVKGLLGHLCGGVLLDTSCIKELQLSEHKAIQPGITASPPMHRDGTSSSSYITRR